MLPLFFAAASAMFGMASASADLILLNGNIYTVNEKQPRAEAIVIQGERIVFVGSNAAAKAKQTKESRVVDLHGKTVLPGLTDAHAHVIGIGERELTLNLEGIATLDDFLERVKAHVAMAKPGEWITGRGWIETHWNPPKFPTRWELDRIAPVNPIFLERADGHGAVVNSAALKIADIDQNTPNPFGGEISREKETGEANGMLLDEAHNLITRHIPPSRAPETEKAVLLTAKRSIELGWCQLQDAGGSYDDVALFRKLYRENKIKLRIYKAVYGPGPHAARLLQEGASVGEFGGRFTLRTIKVVLDGALGSRGAALLQPYQDAPETKGLFRVKEDELRPLFAEALQRGIQIQTHAIGDRANRLILDLYDRAMKTHLADKRAMSDSRWRVEHAQIVDPSDIPRFKRIGIIPSMQPSHAIGDLFFAPARLGQERLAGAYAWKSLIKSGAIIAGGSDAPVERGEPMIEFYAAVARKSVKGFTGEGWHPEEAVSREDALRMFTVWPAYAAFEEKDRGTIEAGKLADLTVLDADIMKIPEADILKTKCVMTVIGGEIVFEKF